MQSVHTLILPNRFSSDESRPTGPPALPSHKKPENFRTLRGKILGLDRCPVAETLREKIKLITNSGSAVEQWAAALAQDWMQGESLEQGVGGLLYLVDGHVRVYHGSQTKLPRHYVARQRLCCRATTDYWVNQPEGSPIFKINQAVDPGMIEVIRQQIVPRLQTDAPNTSPPQSNCRQIPNCAALRWCSIAKATVRLSFGRCGTTALLARPIASNPTSPGQPRSSPKPKCGSRTGRQSFGSWPSAVFS